MPDRRHHRGPHPQDVELFAPDQLARLRQAVADLSWLLGRGYAIDAALALVGDHLQLQRRQRRVVARAASAPAAAASRRSRRVPPAGRPVVVDGFNLVVTVEAALSGGLLYRCPDGLLRDLASVHGTWRTVEETDRAVELLSGELARADRVRWLLDRPVSNSGRLAERLRARGWAAEPRDDVDGEIVRLSKAGWAVATADGPLLDRVGAAVDLAGPVVDRLPDAWVIDLSPTAPAADR